MAYSNTWEALPNPPSEIHPRQMITAVIESRKQILVTSLLELPNNERSAYSEAKFYTYNVTTRCWATLESPVRKLRGGSIHKLSNVAVGNTYSLLGFLRKRLFGCAGLRSR